MSAIALEMNAVSKKFRKGEIYDSLRDFIPAMASTLLKRKNDDLQNLREFWALKDVSFEVKSGEAFGIIGPNGAGKSTILKILSGIMHPTKGNMRVNGTLSALIEVGAGFHPDLTGRENIFLNATILGMTKDEILQKFDEIVEFAGLAEFIDTPVKRYSSGMYARLGFSVAAHVDPDILIVDEVLSVGDYLFQKKCFERMTSVIKSGATVVFVSHNLKAVADLCDRAILLDRGRIIANGSSDEVIKQYMARALSHEASLQEKEVFISKVAVCDRSGERVQFKAGQKAEVLIEVTGMKDCDGLSLTIVCEDEDHYHVFDTSTQRLGYPTFSIKRGETLTFVFELYLHFATGTYHFGAAVYRYDIQKEYDRKCPAATVYINSENDVRGVANLYPKVIAHAHNAK